MSEFRVTDRGTEWMPGLDLHGLCRESWSYKLYSVDFAGMNDELIGKKNLQKEASIQALDAAPTALFLRKIPVGR